MDKFRRLYEKFSEIIVIILLILIITILIFIIYKVSHKEEKNNSNWLSGIQKVSAKKIDEIDQSKPIKVDIKGAVKNPGVYEINNNSNVADLINIAGGLTKKANTNNLNLSRALEDQMVVKVYTTNELEKQEEIKVSECVCPEVEITKCENNSIIKTAGENINASITDDKKQEDTNESKLISINTATKEELMTVSGIGESKAIAIIEYRTTNGNFNSIEEIKNVSGIGDSLFEKIKSYITI